MCFWQDMASITVRVLGREFRMINVSPDTDQLFDTIKQRIRDEDGIPKRFLAVHVGDDENYYVGLHSFKRIDHNHMHRELLQEMLELLPRAKLHFAQREHSTVMPLYGDVWSSEELHVQTYVSLRQWCYENGYTVGNDRTYGPGGPGGPADPDAPPGPPGDVAYDVPPLAKARPRAGIVPVAKELPVAKVRPPAKAKALPPPLAKAKAKLSPAPEAKRRLASRAR